MIPKTIKECLEFMGQSVNEDSALERIKFDVYCIEVNKIGMKILNLDGETTASVGDYIIKGVNGEFYPCNPYIFEQTYERVGKKNDTGLIRRGRVF